MATTLHAKEFQREYEKELENEPTTPSGEPTLRWLLTKVQRGEMTAEEFVKLSKQRGDLLRDFPFDSQT